MYERFLIQSHVASDFCGSFRVKQRSLFPPFNLERLERQSRFIKPHFSAEIQYWVGGRGSVGKWG
jgi:hypothetical protein